MAARFAKSCLHAGDLIAVKITVVGWNCEMARIEPRNDAELLPKISA
jgi:hypothetical protein